MKKKCGIIVGIVAGVSVCAVFLGLILQKMIRVCDYIDDASADDDFDDFDITDYDIE